MIDWTRRTEPEELPEWMDEPCSRQDLRDCLADLEAVNTLSLGYCPTMAFLRKVTSKPVRTPLRILDVGFGGGGLLHRIARWAARRCLSVELTGIDLNPETAALARQRYGSAPVRWLSGDVFAYTEGVDVVLSSLLTHHLPTPGVVQFLRWMETSANVGWFVNDLHRSRRSALLFGRLAQVMRWHRFVHHDGPVSFARSFSPEDWRNMLVQAGLPPGAANVQPTFPARLCVSRLR